MNTHLWMLAPWAVFAVAAGVQFWRMTRVFRNGLRTSSSVTERFRRSLERRWQSEL